MKTKTLLLATLATVFATTAVTPTFAAGDPVKQQRVTHRLIKRADLDGDNRVSLREFRRAINASFAVIDTNGDHQLTRAELAHAPAAYKAHNQHLKLSARVVRLPAFVSKRFARIDRNGDGMLSRREVNRVAIWMFKRRDRNKDSHISVTDLRS